MVEIRKELYDNWMQIWNGDYDKMSSMISDDFVGHWPDNDVKGPSELGDMIKMTREYFYDIDFKPVISPVVGDQKISGHWKMTALYQGNMEGAKAEEGTAVTFKGMDILIFNDGKCVEYYVLSDMFSLMKQLKAF